MIYKIIFIGMWLVCCMPTSQLFSQSTWNTSFDLNRGYNDGGENVIIIDSSIYISSEYLCHFPITLCTKIVNINFSGQIILNQEIKNFGIQGDVLLSRNENVFIGGYNFESNEEQFIYDYLKSSITKKLYSDSISLLYIASMVIFDKYFILSSNGATKENNLNKLFLFWYDMFELKDTLIINKYGFNDQIGDMAVGPDSLLTVFTMYQDTTIFHQDYYRRLTKFDKHKNVKWEYETEPIRSANVSDQGLDFIILDNGNMVYTNIKDRSSRDPSLYCIDNEKNKIWAYHVPPDFSRKRLINMSKTKNNDILVCGYYNKDNRGWLMKISETGQLLWEHLYVYDAPENHTTANEIYDVKELPDGRIVTVGRKRNYHLDSLGTWQSDFDTWVMMLDENGCLDQDDCGYEIKLSSTTSTTQASQCTIHIYPNPTQDELIIEISAKAIVSVYDVVGKKVIDNINLQSGENSIDVSTLRSGIYFVLIGNDGGEVHTEKVVIAR